MLTCLRLLQGFSTYNYRVLDTTLNCSFRGLTVSAAFAIVETKFICSTVIQSYTTRTSHKTEYGGIFLVLK